MGLDGFAMGNLGLNTELTSAQMANQADHLAQKESQVIIKSINESAEQNGVKQKKSNDEQDSGSQKRKKKNQQQQQEEDEQEIENLLYRKGFNGANPREFSIRVNADTEMIELISVKDKRIIETIKAEELMGMLSKLDSSSGILLNRKI